MRAGITGAMGGTVGREIGPAPADTRRAVVASAIGNVLEWYDFGVYVFFAAVIGRNFFPSENATAALLSSFGVFGVGFLMRPLGGIIIGRFGDTHGRKAALIFTVMAMAFGTVLVGVLPTYAMIGVAAPVLLVVARLIQGFSAGGEWGGATAFMVEWAPHGHRGWYGSFQQASIAASLVLASGTGALFSSLLSADQLAAWGWRIPFLLGIVVALVGVYLRRQVDETPAYRAAEAQALPLGGERVQAGAAGVRVHHALDRRVLYFPVVHADIHPVACGPYVGAVVVGEHDRTGGADGADPGVRGGFGPGGTQAAAAAVVRGVRGDAVAVVLVHSGQAGICGRSRCCRWWWRRSFRCSRVRGRRRLRRCSGRWGDRPG